MSSMSFKYFVEFDEDGEIKGLYKSKNGCDESCGEYIVKLIPIERTPLDDLSDNTKRLLETSKKFSENVKKVEPEFNKVLKNLARKIR